MRSTAKIRVGNTVTANAAKVKCFIIVTIAPR